MQRISSLAACRELGSLAAASPGGCARYWACSRRPAGHRWWAGMCVSPACPFSAEPVAPARGLCRHRVVFAGQKHRPFSSRPGDDGPPRSSDRLPAVSVVGIPDPITWIRCKVLTLLIKLYFEVDLSSEEFERGVKQALVHVSSMMSSSSYHRLVGIVSTEMIEYVEEKCRALTAAQRRQLAVKMDDILFVLPEEVSVVFDEYGRKFCFVVLRFWLLSTHEGPDDPEGTKIFRVASSEDGGPQKKLATAVYEFHRELTRGACPDWKVTTVWHWHWKVAE
ncbi:m-AAA protease-interacting protein 1, mitochondrial [Pempheris klunzingeri]|uniref:m-AAA protease-interacting protein 1, mitochondrial n=1 Tax=Pempheris klunzingeri TaxID=3127111 RepID=UPI0039811446